MSFFKRLHQRREADMAATENSRALLEEALRTDPEVDEQHERALAQLQQASAQAHRLGATDRQNHYSESLTHAFRGRTT